MVAFFSSVARVAPRSRLAVGSRRSERAAETRVARLAFTRAFALEMGCAVCVCAAAHLSIARTTGEIGPHILGQTGRQAARGDELLPGSGHNYLRVSLEALNLRKKRNSCSRVHHSLLSDF